MSSTFTIRSRPHAAAAALALTALCAAILALTEDDAAAKAKASKTWRNLAKKVRTSVRSEAKADYVLALARASLIDDEDRREEAEDDAKEEYRDALELAGDQYDARLDLALRLGEDEPYSVDIDPDDFVDVIDNPYLPFTPGTTLTYEANTEDGTETIVVTVLSEKKTILGVECTVVRDTVSIDGVLVEDTLDWYAQDTDGNVWYFGEIALNYEDGDISDVDGSWIAGKDGAQPGIVMPAAPAVGRIYRQEFYLGEAEDYAEVLATDASASVPYGSFESCVRTFDGQPMDPEAQETKYYAVGIGVVLEEHLNDDERTVLISRTTE